MKIEINSDRIAEIRSKWRDFENFDDIVVEVDEDVQYTLAHDDKQIVLVNINTLELVYVSSKKKGNGINILKYARKAFKPILEVTMNDEFAKDIDSVKKILKIDSDALSLAILGSKIERPYQIGNLE